MNIPLNIDWQQILLHLFNFAILAFGLYFLLYKPVKQFMDKREDHYKTMDEEAEKTKAEAEGLKETYEKKLADADEEIRAQRAEAEKETRNDAAAEIARAKGEAQKILSDARTEAKEERERIIASSGKEIASLAAAAADKLVKEALSDE